MVQVRCIKAIGSFDVGDIVDIENGVADTINGVAGAIISKDLGDGPRIIFVIDDAIDSIGKTIRVQAPESMAKYFSYDTTPPDPNEPDPEVNCALTTLLDSAEPSKTYANGINTFRLVPASSSFVLEFATELDGITKAGAAIVNIEYYQVDKQTDGSYLIDVEADGTVQTILIRQRGCTSSNISPASNDFFGGRFHAYETDNEGEVPTPIAGKVNVPVGAIMWDGWFEDYQLTPRTGISGTPYERGINQASLLRWDLTEFASLNVVPFYGQQGLPSESIEIITKVTWNPTLGENEYQTVYKNVTCKFDRSQTAFDKEIGFALDAGIDYMAFNWYSPYDTPMAEGQRKFVDSSNRGTMKMCYLSGPIGWNITANVDYITDQMEQSYYQQIDSKPLLFVNEDWLDPRRGLNDTTILQLIKNSYASKVVGGTIYVVYMSGGRDYPTEEPKYSTHGMSGASIYVTYGVEGYGPRPHSQILDDEIRLRNVFLNSSGRDIVPVITTGFVNCSKRSELGLLDETNYYENYTDKATGAEMDTKMASVISFIDSTPRAKTLLFYAWNENAESGNPICPTLTNGTQYVTVASLNVAGANTGVNRATLDKVKQYCKK
jgi:hypothetical protein